MYDFLIVGAGLFGSVFAHEAYQKGYKCLVLEKRAHIGGNIFCDIQDNIHIHKYGAHIFHTNSKDIWNYVNQFVTFNNFINSPIANYNGELYNLPFNMNTYTKIWRDITTPKEAQNRIKEQASQITHPPRNLEEQAISLVGKDIYLKLIKGYTEKQWNKECKDLPPSIIKRLPVRFTFDNNYFNSKYQGIPNESYNQLIQKLLENADVRLNSNYLKNRVEFDKLAKKLIYTGPIDEFFDYKFGHLEYRSLKFETIKLDTSNFQGNAVINYTAREIPYTRIIEHKHFLGCNNDITYITREYPKTWAPGDDAYYPINDEKNSLLLKKYQDMSNQFPNIIFGGRLGSYSYLDMDQVIDSALKLANQIL